MRKLCKLFESFSADTWSAIGDSSQYYGENAVGLKETSITDGLLLRLHRHGRQNRDCVVSVPSEIRTGADLELIVVSGRMGAHFRMQAKRLRWQTRKYHGLAHSRIDPAGVVQFQMDTLCQTKGYMPLYLFYNWYPNANSPDEQRLLNQGCALASANSVRAKCTTSTDRLNVLPLAALLKLQAPWSVLVCPQSAGPVDLSLVAANAARTLGGGDEVDPTDVHEVRRPLEDAYAELWRSRGLDGLRDISSFKRPVIMVGSD
jgi:hypothetical protein